MDRCHHQGGWHSLPADIANDDPQPAICKREEIVEVATDFACRLVVGCELPSRERRHIFGQKGVLNSLGRPQLLLNAFAFAHLHLLHPHHLGYVQRRCDLGSEGIEHGALLAGIGFAFQMRPQDKQPKQFSLTG